MKLPYKYRGLALILLLAVVLPVAMWHFALSDTFGTWRDCRRLAAQLATTGPAAETGEPAVAMAEGPELILSGGLLDTVRNVTAESTVRVAGYVPLVTAEQDCLAVHTARLTLTGGYTALLQVVGKLERTLTFCRVRSMEWHTEIDRQLHCTRLTLTLYIQQIVQKT